MRKRIVSIRVNGTLHELFVAPSRVLLEVLREDLGLTGTKFGCEMGECGACTVLVDGEPALSCLTLAALCDGKEVMTVEGLVGRESEIVQRAFVETGASQCGYCTPGMAIMFHYLRTQGGRVDVHEALSGNLCRCTGYVKIIEAYGKAIELEQE